MAKRAAGVGMLLDELFDQRDIVGMNGDLCAVCMSHAA